MYVFTLHSIMYVGEANFHQSSKILLELLKTQIVSQSINAPPPLQDHVTTLPLGQISEDGSRNTAGDHV